MEAADRRGCQLEQRLPRCGLGAGEDVQIITAASFPSCVRCVVFKSLKFGLCVQVNLLDAMENMDQETFEFRFGEELVYTTLLSDGQMADLIPGGSNVGVRYEDRKEFIRLVQKVRLEESKQQVGL